MNRKLLTIALFLGVSAFAADRLIKFRGDRLDPTSTQVHLQGLADGGCSIDACFAAQSEDGGMAPDGKCTSSQELSGTALTRCLNIFNSAETLWRNKTGY